MNVSTIYSSDKFDSIFQNELWQKADYFYYETSSMFWNCASLIILSKQYANTAEDALLYLLKKQAYALGIWEKQWPEKSPTVQEFISFFMAEKGFNNFVGTQMKINTFDETYKAIISGIVAEPSFTCFRNHKPHPFNNMIETNDVKNVISFDDSWCEHNFLIETKASWVLYHWSSVV